MHSVGRLPVEETPTNRMRGAALGCVGICLAVNAIANLVAGEYLPAIRSGVPSFVLFGLLYNSRLAAATNQIYLETNTATERLNRNNSEILRRIWTQPQEAI
jgi:hypothetical protein